MAQLVRESKDEQQAEEEPCRFFRLPRELRDEIYDYAYAGKSNQEYWHIITDKDMNARKIPLAGEKWTAPHTFCRSALVNKQFMAEALPLFIRNTTIHFSRPRDFDQFLLRFPMVKENITSVFIKLDILAARFDKEPIGKIVNCCPRLTRFEACFYGRVWYDVHILTGLKLSFQFNAIIERMKSMNELKEFKLSSSGFFTEDLYLRGRFQRDVGQATEEVKECVLEDRLNTIPDG